MTPIKKAMDNKIISGIVVVIFGLLMTWGIYVTKGQFENEKIQATSQKVIEGVCSDVDQLKKDTKEIRVELKEQRDIIYKGQEKIFERLGSIHKNVGSISKSVEMNSEKASREPVMLEKEVK